MHIAGPMVSCYFYSPHLAIVGQACQNMIMGLTTKHLHKTKRHDSIFDGRNSIVIMVKT